MCSFEKVVHNLVPLIKSLKFALPESRLILLRARGFSNICENITRSLFIQKAHGLHFVFGGLGVLFRELCVVQELVAWIPAFWGELVLERVTFKSAHV